MNHRAAFGCVALFAAVLPGSALAAPELLDCSRSSEPTYCRQSQEQYRAERAKAREYTPMRNVAYCQWTGCDGAFRINRQESCGIRRQVMKQHPKKVDGNDELHFANCVQAGY